jgi:hypothetical protein
MKSEFNHLDIDVLQVLYQKEVNRLKEELLAGASWESVQERKNRVTELAIVIHKKKYPLYFNPAEFDSPRNSKDNGPE